MNTTLPLLETMINRYNELSYTHSYIYGFSFQGMIYYITETAETMPYILKLDKASRGAGYSLRFLPTREQKLLLLTKGAKILCSREFFETIVKNSKYNKGEIFEKLITEYFGHTWKKDNIPFSKAGDLNINGTVYQIKFERATFVSERTLARIKK